MEGGCYLGESLNKASVVTGEPKERPDLLDSGWSGPITDNSGLLWVCGHPLAANYMPKVRHLPLKQVALFWLELQAVVIQSCKNLFEVY